MMFFALFYAVFLVETVFFTGRLIITANAKPTIETIPETMKVSLNSKLPLITGPNNAAIP